MLQRSTLTELDGILPWPHGSTGVCMLSRRSRDQLLSYQRGAISQRGTGRDRFSGCRSTWRHHSSISTFRLALSSFPKWGARYAMNWNTGSQHPWPSQPFRIISGELLLVSSGGLDFGLMRLKRNVVYPGLPDAAGADIRITLKVIQESRLEISAGDSGQEGCQWLDEQLSQLLGIAASAVPSSDSWLCKAAALHHQFEQRHQALLDTHQPLNSSATETLWLAMEHGKPPEEPTEDPVLRALSLLCEDHGAITPLPARHQGLEPRQRLDQLLARTDLFARDVLIDRADLQQDCGDLIGFLDTESGEQTEVMVLQSTAKGYQAWVPSQMSHAQPLEHCTASERLSPRMLSITAFRPKDHHHRIASFRLGILETPPAS